MLRNSLTRYGAIAQIFHWVIVVLIITQFVLAFIFENMPRGMEKIAIIGQHKSFGMTILILASLRLFWKLFNPQPELPLHMKPYQRHLAKITHWGLYVVLFALPLSGWIMSSVAKIPVSYFGLFKFPNLISPNKDWVELTKDVHGALVYLLLVLLILHIVGVVYHQFFVKDGIMYRMLPETLQLKKRRE